MAGYGGQLVALDVEPLDITSPLLKAQQIRSQTLANDQTQQESPLRIQQMKQQVESGDLTNAEARRRGTMSDLATQNALIASAAGLVDPDDPDAASKWDEAMKAAGDKGAAGAGQFVGRYSAALQKRVTGAYSAPSPLAAQSALSNQTGTTPDGTPQSQYDVMFKDKTPAELQSTLTQMGPITDAAKAVLNSQNPVETWNTKAREIGHPEWANVTSPMQAVQAAQDIVSHSDPLRQYLQTRVAMQAGGAPAPIVPPTQKAVGDVLYNIDQRTGKATVAAGGKWSLVGTDPDTKDGVYVNTDTGAEKRGSMPLAAKPGNNSGRQSVFSQRQQAWLDVHPDDAQGALDYAGGRKNMTPEQARVAATAQAARDLQAATLAGEQITDANAYLRQQADAHYAEITTASAPTAPHASAPAAEQIPQRAVSQLREGAPHTFNNGQVWTLKNGKPVRLK